MKDKFETLNYDMFSIALYGKQKFVAVMLGGYTRRRGKINDFLR
jgi:hypothetical protein